MSLDGVVDAVVDFDAKTATCTVAKDMDPAKLLTALQEPYSGTVKQ